MKGRHNDTCQKILRRHSNKRKSVRREDDSKYEMVRLILRSVAINRNNIREVSLCKWLICLPEMYPAVICIFAAAEISRISFAEL